MKLRAVPMTVSLSLIMLCGWVYCALMALYIPDVASATMLLTIAIIVVAFVLAILTTSLLVRPFDGKLETQEAVNRSHFIGTTCKVKTGSVSDSFGQANLKDDAGVDLLIQVRCDHQNAMKRGDEALIVSFDRNRSVYVVEPLEEAG